MPQTKKGDHKKTANGILKKGMVGTAANYVTRNMALKKLQLSLPDFRYESPSSLIGCAVPGRLISFLLGRL